MKSLCSTRSSHCQSLSVVGFRASYSLHVRRVVHRCEACAHAKAKQKNIYRKQENDRSEEAEEVNGRVYLDLATIRAPKDINVKYFLESGVPATRKN